MKRPKVAFLDLNNTCLQMKGATREQIERYVNHIRHSSWHPLTLPNCWRFFEPWPELGASLNAFFDMEIKTVTLSNNPIDVQIDQCRHAMVQFDWMVPLESYHVFKPDVKAYQVACHLLNVAPEDALMVTANKDFGDLEGAASIGMPSVWIDRKNDNPNRPIKNLMDLVRSME